MVSIFDWTWYIPQVADASGDLPISATHTPFHSLPKAFFCKHLWFSDKALSLPLHGANQAYWGVNISGRSPQPLTDGSWGMNTPASSSSSGATHGHVLQCLPEQLGAFGTQSLILIICSITHFLWASFPSLSHFPIPPPVFPEVIPQINYLTTIFISEYVSRGTQINTSHFRDEGMKRKRV